MPASRPRWSWCAISSRKASVWRSRAPTKNDANKKLLNREEFLAKVWEWKAYSGGTITGQLRRLGASCDWSRERFTMDEGLSKAVLKVFVDLYRQGLIYKDNRLVNWDPKMLTAISDLEVESREVRGSLWYFKYPIEGSDEHIVVATTRPETMLGDTAVAVHPGRSQVEAPDRQARHPAAGRPAHPDRRPTNIPTRRRAPARSRSRRRTTSTTSRSAGATSSRRSRSSTSSHG